MCWKDFDIHTPGTPKRHVAIIGGGLSGLGLALALHAHSISCTVWESSPSTGRPTGAVMLSPNSLRILDRYGVYALFASQGYNFDVVEIRGSDGVLKDNGFYAGSEELFGYHGLRIYRSALLKVLTRVCIQRGVRIVYDKKFQDIVSDVKHGKIRFRFHDGTISTADVLVAADGIYSKIRKLMFPEVEPVYSGVLIAAGAVQAEHLHPTVTETELETGQNETGVGNMSIVDGRNGAGACLLLAQNADATEFLTGTQGAFPDQSREEWARLSVDRQFHLDFMRRGYHDRLPVIQKALDNIMPDSTYIWPLSTLPKLNRWYSETGRVVLIGDAAHAIPPVSAQGANQAFEDGWTLANVLNRVFDSKNNTQSSPATFQQGLKEALSTWHMERQTRIDRILKLTQQMNNLRLPIEEQEKLPPGEIYRSLSTVASGEGGGNKAVDEDEMKRMVVEQWGWLYGVRSG